MASGPPRHDALIEMEAQVQTNQAILSIRNVSKRFGAGGALRGVDFDVHAGEVVALVGDNGAGKSTLIKIIAGVERPSAGRIAVDGAEGAMAGPRTSQALGIQVVYQDLALADRQPVYMNLFLGKELTTGPFRRLDRKAMIAQTE